MGAKVFADFSSGEAGTLDLAKVPDTMWRGKNLLVYKDGSLGPRPGLRLLPVGRSILGPVRGIGHIESVSGRNLIYVDDTVTYGSPLAGGASTSFGSIGSAPTTRTPALIYDVTSGTGFMHVPSGGRSLRVLPNDAVVQDLNVSGGVAGTVYGIRLVRSDTSGRRFYYSSSDNAFNWPPGNFTDISISSRIVFLCEQRGHLTVLTGDGSWWVLTGVPGVNDNLRRISGGRLVPARIAPNAVVNLGDDLVHYLNPVNNYPGSFDGVEHNELPYLTLTPEDPQASYAAVSQESAYTAAAAFQGVDNSSPAFVLRSPGSGSGDNGRMLLSHNGVWTRHAFEFPMSNMWASNGRGRIFGFDMGATDVGLQILTANLRHDRPAFVTDPFARPGDNRDQPLDAEVTFPEVWSDDGDELQVKEVMIDFVRWNTGVVEPNRIITEVTALARGSEVAPITGSRTWEQPGSLSPAAQAGTRDRLRHGFGEQGTGAGWRVRLHGLRGAAIRQVVVFYDPVASNQRVW